MQSVPQLIKPLPLLVTELKVSTVLIFDLGVYLCVWGALAGYALALLALQGLAEAAKAAANRIAEKSLLTVLAIKEAVNRSQETSLREGTLHERRLFNALFATEDQAEGMSAFIDKREPQFRDK